ncbi:uncharacterized protein LAESUDRAFT_731352 [Laetiporus sulphureus 93-53]|uniref:Uncharacterized protein n=1 Tax=Laetiporus sulphureus 93-53 TaxID=1314785 RepID=A0A165BND1_9APHY|nr:uncharacterized protein LAESUDRAFT_731352 [Laetiporus sulphureus 93-53]KZT01358.1 hypothetical protein LAESUDRAFT_731352 [Laetiporus sulphureus 93-53]
MKIDTGNPDRPNPNEQDPADRDPWLVAICSMPTYRNVNEIVLQAQQTVDADSNAYIAWDTWCDALAHFNELQILRIRNFVQFSDLANILYALSELHPGEDMRTEPPCILPRLRVLDLDKFDFFQARDRSCLLDCLKQRRDVFGAPVQELVLSRCEGISREFLVELMGCVDTILKTMSRHIVSNFFRTA